ncbi:STAS domain-containing protein [Halomonas sp. WWR20]
MSVLLDREDGRLEVCDDCRLTVSGEADFETAAPLAAAGNEWLRKQSASTHVTLDLTGVERASSAVLSVLLEWIRTAKTHGVTIASVSLSAPLARLAAIAELECLLPGNKTPTDAEPA